MLLTVVATIVSTTKLSFCMPTSSMLSTASKSQQPPWYYQSAIAILKPLYRMQVWRRSHKRDNYQQEVAQRFGLHYPARPDLQTTHNQLSRNLIWCHAVSLGETNTIAPLLDALMAKGYSIWLTNTTQTGFSRGATRFATDINEGRLSHSYVPVDSPAVIDKFLNHVQPTAALFVETELWANILSKLSERSIPSILVNGRLSASSFNSYQKISTISASMMQNLTLIIAQDTESAKRFRQLGAHSAKIRVAGSLKWVINTPQANTLNIASNETNNVTEKLPIHIDLKTLNRPIWVAASTHNGEETTALAWQRQLLADYKLAQTLLIIVPRHPERFDDVATLVQATGLNMARRSRNESVVADTQVYLADTMGELMQWYEQADVALVGGSLVDIGGHNPVEPASVATPVLIGQYTQSCQAVVDKLAETGALYQPNNPFYHSITDSEFSGLKPSDSQVKGKSEALNQQTCSEDQLLYHQLQTWLSQPSIAKAAGQKGAQLTQQQQTILTRQLTMIEQVIEQSVSHYVSNANNANGDTIDSDTL